MAISTETTSKIAAPQDPQDPPGTSGGNTIMATPRLPQQPPDDPPDDPPEPLPDTTPPTLTINLPANVTRSAPPYTATITGTAKDNFRGSGVAAVEWRLGTSGAFQAASGTNNWVATVPLPPQLGAYTVEVRAWDNAGNIIDPPHKVTIHVVDITGPTLTIVPPLKATNFRSSITL